MSNPRMKTLKLAASIFGENLAMAGGGYNYEATIYYVCVIKSIRMESKGIYIGNQIYNG